MLDNDRIAIFISLVCFFVAHLTESIAEQNARVNVNDEESGQLTRDDSLEHWKGRWMPSRAGEYTPPPKIFHRPKNTLDLLERQDEESLKNWKGRWMPSRPGEYTPPPKVFHKQKIIGKFLKKHEDNSWKGRWMPSRPGEYAPPPKIFHKNNQTEQTTFTGHRYVNTGIHYLCDDGLHNLEVDWDRSSASYTCFGKKIVPDFSVVPEYYCETIPKNYRVMHQCMSETIRYAENVPTFGTSRPVWPVYGEYEYLPAQRWLRSLERGAIVMLYHPCANTLQVERLKSFIKSCLSSHIISPNSYLNEDRPFALLSWGCKLSMSYVDEKAVKQFISENALHPGNLEDGGIYSDGLKEKSGKTRHFCP